MSDKLILNFISKLDLDIEVKNMIDATSNDFIQELMDSDRFYEEGGYLSKKELDNILAENLTAEERLILQISTTEFCITNFYILEGGELNCIDHMLKEYPKQFLKEEKQFLKALNNSYASIYKTSIIGDQIRLKDMVTEKEYMLDISKLPKAIKPGSLISTRILNYGTLAKPEYHLSSILFLKEKSAKRALKTINMISSLMDQEPSISNSKKDELLKKKMWAKEIMEQWYFGIEKQNKEL